jgi:tetratricopeptide (TPR) repeat protein
MVAAALCCMSWAPARAEDNEGAREDDALREPKGEEHAWRSYDLAQKLYDKGYYDQAALHLRKAYRQSPQPAFLLNLGLTCLKNGKREEAREALERYLVEASHDAPHRSKVVRLLGRLEGETATHAPRATRAKVAPVATAASITPIEDEENPLVDRPRRAPASAAALAPRIEPRAATTPTPTPTDDQPRRYRYWKWAVAGLSLASLTAGVVMLASASGQEDLVRREAAPDGSAPTAVYDERLAAYYETAKTHRTLGTVALIAGGAAAAGTVALFLLDRKEKARARVEIRPTLGPGLVTILGEGSF